MRSRRRPQRERLHVRRAAQGAGVQAAEQPQPICGKPISLIYRRGSASPRSRGSAPRRRAADPIVLLGRRRRGSSTSSIGLVGGSIYALAALGLVSTYLSSGVLNFAFGSFAYFVARLYYFLHVQHSWAIVPAALFSIVVSPRSRARPLGRRSCAVSTRASTLIKVGATIGISVALSALAQLRVRVNPVVEVVPGLAPAPEPVYHLLGSLTITLDQVDRVRLPRARARRRRRSCCVSRRPA